MPALRNDGGSRREFYGMDHRFEHWYRDNSVYFVTASCRDHFPALRSEDARAAFWDRSHYYMFVHGFQPWVVSVLDTHYHVIGYLRQRDELGEMMRKIHGSIAKLVKDLLPGRRVPFWREGGGRDYFDGCLRDEKQYRLAYRYTLMQSVRHGIVCDYRPYPHTRVMVGLQEGLKVAKQLNTFLPSVPYKRYERGEDGRDETGLLT